MTPAISANIYLLRHGETEWNAQGRFQGRLDSALTAKGRAQVVHMGRRLARALPPASVVQLQASPLGRALQTTEILRGLGDWPVPILDVRLQEVSLGSWDGLTLVEIDAEWPGRLDGSTSDDWYFRSPDGEGYFTALNRARSWLTASQGTVVAVSHGLFGRLIRAAYLDLPPERAMSLPVPHDTIWHLHEGRVRALGDGTWQSDPAAAVETS